MNVEMLKLLFVHITHNQHKPSGSGYSPAESEDIMRTYSVQIEENSYNDDLFNGTFNECVDYIKKNGYTREENDARIAEIEVDENGTVTFTHDIITEF